MTVIFVSTIGGHLSQLYALRPRFSDLGTDDIVWVTHDSPQSRSLLKDEETEFVPYIDERDLAGVIRATAHASRLIRRTEADLVVSTGSAIACAYLPMARMLGRDAAFIDSAAMVDGHTRTGRILERVPGVQLLTQSPATTEKRWRNCGSVFDGFQAACRPLDRPPKKLVVMVGTSTEFGFRSLLERLVTILPDDLEVLWQTGSTDVAGLPIDATPWLPAAELESAIREADLVISHAGGGSALAALMNGHRPCLIPRRSSHGEFRDDHQFQIAELLAAKNLAVNTAIQNLSWPELVELADWRVSPTQASNDPITLRAHLDQ